MTFGRRRRRTQGWAGLVSMADVAFNLLLFFILTSAAGRGPAVAVQLPLAGSAVPSTQAGVVTLAVSADGAFSLDDRPVLREALPSELQALLAARRLRVVRLAADRGAAWSEVVYALDSARSLGVAEVELAAGAAP
ncbi:MAG: biopolymer transporter ExbD [Fimbriimonadaceae bacterium]|nr:biopolymer transporter ExbD [Fimbriimonadaceae bacterium]